MATLICPTGKSAIVEMYHEMILTLALMYHIMIQSVVIQNFKDELAKAAFEGVALKGFQADLLVVTRRKLGYLNAAATLSDLRAPPGNRLEALKGNRRGQHSIRVNDQWRICFVWTAEGPKDVEFVDYH
jgi:proteic killer suppression protein